MTENFKINVMKNRKCTPMWSVIGLTSLPAGRRKQVLLSLMWRVVELWLSVSSVATTSSITCKYRSLTEF